MTDLAPALIPELSVRDWQRSVAFYRELLGFSVCYLRPEDGFAMLEREGARIMLDQIGVGRDFAPLVGAISGPLGRGVNLQIPVSLGAPILAALEAEGWPLVIDREDRWYRVGDTEVGNRQFVVADPDGYLLRFYQDLGSRAVKQA
ncbi:bleomycin resistance protein [Thioclava sp. FR2]|uniref:bleomycin resistance protein n=1 Tax=Thioclava sp. FR2 TaxID=3445780 RepID=UPI003EB90B94